MQVMKQQLQQAAAGQRQLTVVGEGTAGSTSELTLLQQSHVVLMSCHSMIPRMLDLIAMQQIHDKPPSQTEYAGQFRHQHVVRAAL
jgi:hypothetical protein